MAENHPIAFRFVMQAKEKGATVIHADPRFTRTSALADIYAPVRAGSDIAFLGGLINYILENDLWFKDYVMNYTNISTIIEDDYKDTSDLDGLFSGWEEDKHSYNSDSWQYKGMEIPSPLAEHYSRQESSGGGNKKEKLTEEPPPTDPTLIHPNCVYQIMRRHYAQYTPEMVERVSGCPKETFLAVAEAITRNSGRERTGAWCYAVGWTHHTTGVQMIRAAAIIQALLGNIGRPGGGILALRGHSSIQGSTDIPTLYHMLPGYLPQPAIDKPHKTFKDYLESETEPTGYWHNFPKFATSLMRAWYGEHATKDNEWGYQWVPKITGDHSQQPMMLAIRDGTIRGLLLMGQNPVIGGHNTHMIRMALPNLEWMVVRETFENETASYWFKSPEVANGELDPSKIQTEMFMLPAALPGEKAGTFTNTHRLIQYHDKVVDPKGDCRSDLWFMYHLGKRLKALYADSDNPWDESIKNLTWDYPEIGAIKEPSADAVLKEVNGYTWPDRSQLDSFSKLKDDGSTACGCWIYTGVFPKDDHNRARSRKPDGPDGPGTHMGWAFAWPANRRIIYNRASADPDGNPWSERKKYAYWDAEKGKWQCPDALDFEPDKAPDYRPDWSKKPQGTDALPGTAPFIMMVDGKAEILLAERPQGRPAADALRAGRVASEEPDVQTAGQPGCKEMAWANQSISPGRRSKIPVRHDNLPADRAPLWRHSHALRPVHCRTPAWRLRGDSAGTRGGKGHQES